MLDDNKVNVFINRNHFYYYSLDREFLLTADRIDVT